MKRLHTVVAALTACPILFSLTSSAQAQGDASASEEPRVEKLGAPAGSLAAGLQLLEAKNYRQAAEKLRKATEETPKQEKAWFNLGVALMETKDYDKAMEAFQQAATLNPGRAGTQLYIGKIREKSGDYGQAIEAYQRELDIRKGKDVGEVYDALGRAYLSNRQYKEAVAAFQQAVRAKRGAATERPAGGARAARSAPAEAPLTNQKTGVRAPARAEERQPTQTKTAPKPRSQAPRTEQGTSIAQAAVGAVSPQVMTDFMDGAAAVEDGDFSGAVAKLTSVTAAAPDLEPAWYFLGLAHYRLANYQDAVTAFERAAQLAPYRPGTHFYLGELYQMQGRMDEAADALVTEVRVRKGKQTAEVLVALGRLYYLTRRYDDALRAIQYALRARPKYVEALYLRGLVHTDLREYERAIEDFKEAKGILDEYSRLSAKLERLGRGQRREVRVTEETFAEDYGKAQEFVLEKRLWPELNKALGDAYDSNEEYGSARNAYRAALRTSEHGSSADPDAHTRIGMAYFHDGRRTLLEEGYISAGASLLDSAIGKFNQALSYNENWAPAQRGLGLVYDLQAANYASDAARGIVSHSFQDAEDAYKKALQIAPDYAEAMVDLGACYNHQERYDEAVAQFEAALKIVKLPEAYSRMATALVGLQRYQEAVSAAEAALALDKTQFEAQNAMGLAYYYSNNLGEAIRHFQLAINLRPSHHQAYTNLGNAYFMNQSWHRARASYRKALDLIPTAQIAGTLFQRAYLHYLIGRAFANAGMHDDAVGAFNKALMLDPSYFDALRALARSYAAMRQFRAGERALQTALQKSPGPAADSEVHGQLGQLFETEGRPHEAIIEYSTAVQIDPNNTAARDALRRLQATRT